MVQSVDARQLTTEKKRALQLKPETDDLTAQAVCPDSRYVDSTPIESNCKQVTACSLSSRKLSRAFASAEGGCQRLHKLRGVLALRDSVPMHEEFRLRRLLRQENRQRSATDPSKPLRRSNEVTGSSLRATITLDLDDFDDG